MQILLRYWLVLISLGLSSCITIPPTPHLAAEQQLQRENLTHWQIEGSVATIAPSSTLTGQFDYRQCGDHYQLQLFGPLHSGLVQLRSDARGYWLIRNGKTRFFKSETELHQMLQLMPLPLDALPFWLKGVARYRDQSLTQNDQITQISNPPWQVEYLSYQVVNLATGGLFLPQRINVQNAHSAIRGKIAIRHWQINEASTCS